MSAQKDWFGHPRGLTILFFTEMWDQFSFFGMRALLVYYMTKQLLIDDTNSSFIYGLYGGFVYLTPLIGGVISDRWLGRRRAVIIGASVMALGHFMMAFEPLFYAALATIAIGNGLFLPSLASQINQLYAQDDPRRATAYNIYYAGINLGAFLSPFICGTVGEIYGWHWGFGLAGIGMVIGLVIYLAGSRYLPSGNDIEAAPKTASAGAKSVSMQTYLLFLAVIAIVVIFRASYEQSGNSLARWIDTGIDRHLTASWSIPMTWFQALNPAFIFVFTPLIVIYWTRAARRGHEGSSIAKMALGAFIVGASYLLLAGVAAWTGQERASWLWVLLYFIVYTVGELFILPVGLSLFGKLAPRAMAATAIAAWFLASFFGNIAAGAVGGLWGKVTPSEFFAVAGAIGLLSGALLLALSPWARKTEAAALAQARDDPALDAAALAADARH